MLEAILNSLFNRTYKQNEIIDNTIRALATVSNEKIDEETGIATRSFYLDEKGTYFVLNIEKFEELTNKISNKYLKENGIVNYNCIKLLEAINIEFSNKCFKTQIVDISRKKLAKFFDREQTELIKELKKYLQILKNTTICFYYIEAGKTIGEYIEMQLCEDETTFNRKELHFVMNSKLYEFLKSNGTYIYLSQDVLKSLNTNLAFRTIVSHKIANRGTDTENVISVKKLYDVLDIREYKEDTREAHFETIRKQFETSLNSISQIEWNYDIETNGRYKKWIKANVIITWKKDPIIANVDE